MCSFIGQKQRNWIGQFALSNLRDNSSGTVTPWADSKVVPSSK